MANPQVENGYTRVANEILDNIARVKLSPTQYRLIFVIWRYTYGFQRKEHDLSLSFLSEATGCDKRQIQRELKRLDEKEIIIQNVKNGSYRKLSFNKNFEEWRVGETTNGETTIGETDNGQTVNTTIGETVKATIGETDNQERNKEKYKETPTVVENPFTFYEQNFGILRPFVISRIEDWLNDLSDELVIESLKIAVRNGKEFNYAEGIMKRWFHTGVKSLDDVKANEQKHDREKPQEDHEPSLNESIQELDERLSLGKQYFKKFKSIEEYRQLEEERERLEQLRANQRQSEVI